MHPETKKLTHKKHALSNTDRKSKATTKPWFSRLLRHPARKQSGSILGQTHTRLLIILALDPHGAQYENTSAYWSSWSMLRLTVTRSHAITNTAIAGTCSVAGNVASTVSSFRRSTTPKLYTSHTILVTAVIRIHQQTCKISYISCFIVMQSKYDTYFGHIEKNK